MRTSTKALLLLLLTLCLVFFTACKSDGVLEDAGEDADRAVEDAGDALEDVGDDIEDATDGNGR